jgi:hypothetical protein
MTTHSTKTQLLKQVGQPNSVPVSTGIVYGTTGVGKTHLLCTAAEAFDKALIISLDRYDETLAKFQNVEYLDLITHASGGVHATMNGLLSELRQAPKTWQFVGFDSVSKLVHLTKQDIIAEERRKDEAAKKPTYQMHDPEIPEQRDWQRLSNRMTGYFWELRRIAISKGFHLWVTAWERQEYRETGDYSGDWFHPDMPAELTRLMLHEFGFCSRLTTTKEAIRVKEGTSAKSRISRVTRHVLASDARDSLTKNRIGFPDRCTDPTVALLLGEESGLTLEEADYSEEELDEAVEALNNNESEVHMDETNIEEGIEIA